MKRNIDQRNCISIEKEIKGRLDPLDCSLSERWIVNMIIDWLKRTRRDGFWSMRIKVKKSSYRVSFGIFRAIQGGVVDSIRL